MAEPVTSVGEEDSAGKTSPENEVCTICKQNYTRPVLLEPCLCVVCERCFDLHMESIKLVELEEPGPCPVCCTPLQLPEGGVISAAYLSELQQTRANQQPRCGWCESADEALSGSVHCADCKMWLCVECDKLLHSKFKDHTVTAACSVDEQRAVESVCPLHPALRHEYWCCEEARCAKCLISEHIGHAHTPLQTHRAALTSHIRDWLSQAETESHKIEKVADDLTERMDELRFQCDALKEKIDDTEQQVIEKITAKVKAEFDTIRQESLSKWLTVNRLTADQLETVTQQRTQLLRSRRRVKHILPAANTMELVATSRSLRMIATSSETTSEPLSAQTSEESLVTVDSVIHRLFPANMTQNLADINIVSSPRIDKESQTCPNIVSSLHDDTESQTCPNVVSSLHDDTGPQTCPNVSEISVQTEAAVLREGSTQTNETEAAHSVSPQTQALMSNNTKDFNEKISAILTNKVKPKSSTTEFPSQQHRTVLCGHWYRSALRYVDHPEKVTHPGPVQHAPKDRKDYVVCTKAAAHKLRVMFGEVPEQPLPHWKTSGRLDAICIYNQTVAKSWKQFESLYLGKEHTFTWDTNIVDWNGSIPRGYAVYLEDGTMILGPHTSQRYHAQLAEKFNLTNYNKWIWIKAERT